MRHARGVWARGTDAVHQRYDNMVYMTLPFSRANMALHPTITYMNVLTTRFALYPTREVFQWAGVGNDMRGHLCFGGGHVRLKAEDWRCRLGAACRLHGLAAREEAHRRTSAYVATRQIMLIIQIMGGLKKAA